MTLGLKFLLCLNGKFFDFKKTSFRYYGLSVEINVFLWGCFYHKDGCRQVLYLHDRTSQHMLWMQCNISAAEGEDS